MAYTSYKLSGNPSISSNPNGVLLPNKIVAGNGQTWVHNIINDNPTNTSVYWANKIVGIIKDNPNNIPLGEKIAVVDNSDMIFGTIVEAFVHGTTVNDLCNEFYNVRGISTALGLGSGITITNAANRISITISPGNVVGYVIDIVGYAHIIGSNGSKQAQIIVCNNKTIWQPFLDKALQTDANKIGVYVQRS